MRQTWGAGKIPRAVCGWFGAALSRMGAFTVVGAGNALVDLGTLNFLAWLMPPGSAFMLVLYNTMGLVLANANSYLWNSRWTFRGEGRAGVRQRVWFAVQAVLNVCLSNAVLWGTVAVLVTHTTLSTVAGENVAKILSALVASSVSFFVMRHFVFRSEQENRGSSRRGRSSSGS